MNGNTFCFALTEIASLWLRQQSNNFPKYCLSFTQVTGGHWIGYLDLPMKHFMFFLIQILSFKILYLNLNINL